MFDIFTKHPKEQNESYLEHAYFASYCGVKLVLIGIAGIIHAILPCVFQKTISEELSKLNKEFEARKLKK